MGVTKKVFRGIGNHQDGDFVWVSEFRGPAEDLFSATGTINWVSKTFAGSFGGLIGLPEILLGKEQWVGRMCARWGSACTFMDMECFFRNGSTCWPPRWKFTAAVEVEPIEDIVEIVEID